MQNRGELERTFVRLVLGSTNANRKKKLTSNAVIAPCARVCTRERERVCLHALTDADATRRLRAKCWRRPRAPSAPPCSTAYTLRHSRACRRALPRSAQTGVQAHSRIATPANNSKGELRPPKHSRVGLPQNRHAAFSPDIDPNGHTARFPTLHPARPGRRQELRARTHAPAIRDSAIPPLKA